MEHFRGAALAKGHELPDRVPAAFLEQPPHRAVDMVKNKGEPAPTRRLATRRLTLASGDRPSGPRPLAPLPSETPSLSSGGTC